MVVVVTVVVVVGVLPPPVVVVPPPVEPVPALPVPEPDDAVFVGVTWWYGRGRWVTCGVVTTGCTTCAVVVVPWAVVVTTGASTGAPAGRGRTLWWWRRW